jgi:hypothetical protein
LLIQGFVMASRFRTCWVGMLAAALDASMVGEDGTSIEG